MPRSFDLTVPEVRFLQVFLNIPQLPFCGSFEGPGPDALRAALDSLMEKGYLTQTPEGTYDVPGKLDFLFRACAAPCARFTMASHTGSREIFLFVKDTVILARENAGGVRLMWLPSLPLAIGHIANVSEPFLNSASAESETRSAAEAEQIHRALDADGFRQEWTCTLRRGDTPEEETLCTVWSDGTQQVMVARSGDSLTISRPCKVDYVNTLARMIAPVHAAAIRAGGVEHGRI